MLAYLSMMAPRLVALRRVMKPTASIYLHCDPRASHYLKLLMDTIFGAASFRNEVVWQRTRGHNDRKLTRFGAVHDTLLFYTNGPKWTFNKSFRTRSEHEPKTHDLYQHTDGKLYRKGDCRAPGGRGPRWEWHGHVHNWRFTPENARELETQGLIVYSKTGMPRVLRPVTPDRGSPLQDVWTDLDAPNSGADEFLEFPTQKPLGLLERIIAASSNKGDTILDPFCGCGTTIEAAQKLDRRWIGIDVTHIAIGLIQLRLADAFPGVGIRSTYRVIGEPDTVDGARRLAREDPIEFEHWILIRIGARPARGDRPSGRHDGGADGRLFFHDEGPGGQPKQIVFSVKSGHLAPTFLRDLTGVLARDKAQIGVLITLEPPTTGMRAEAAGAGFYESPLGTRHPRLQLLTVAQILDGKLVDYPARTGANVTFRRGSRTKGPGEQPELGI